MSSKLSRQELDKVKLDKEMFDTETFENFCGACDNYMTDSCPFNGKVQEDTLWESIKCEYFMD